MMGAEPVILYDGVCGLCNRFVQFVLKRDGAGRFRFAALQGAAARGFLKRHGKDPGDLDTVYVVVDPGREGERLLRKSRAALFVLDGLGGPWKLARALGLIPEPLLDWAYDRVAAARYRLFGKYEACPRPDERVRPRFLDD